MLILDTHILLESIPGRLTKAERTTLERDQEWGISAIVLWEIETLYQRRRIPHRLDHPVLMALVDRVHILPLTAEVCLHLRRLDFRSDPVDEIIAATSLAHDAPLVTRDGKIRASKLIRFAG